MNARNLLFEGWLLELFMCGQEDGDFTALSICRECNSPDRLAKHLDFHRAVAAMAFERIAAQNLKDRTP
jgi:hypothetical protein